MHSFEPMMPQSKKIKDAFLKSFKILPVLFFLFGMPVLVAFAISISPASPYTNDSVTILDQTTHFRNSYNVYYDCYIDDSLVWSDSQVSTGVVSASCPASAPSSSGTYSYGVEYLEPLNNDTWPSYSSVTVQARPALVDGSCSATHYSCAKGTSASNVSGASSWTWSCNGLNNGTNDTTCSEAKPVNGTCGSTNNACIDGSSSDTTDSATQYKWDCNGLNGGDDISCTLNKPVNGTCSATHYGCATGTSASNVNGTSSWTWSCNGLNNGTNDTTCSEAKPADCTVAPFPTVTSGSGVTAYSAASVTYPSTCVSETRTCTNGTLSGTYGNTSCSVSPATLTITANDDSKTYGQTKTYGSGSTAFTSSGLQNGQTIGSVTLTSTSGSPATAAVSGSPYAITPSAPTGGTISSANYTITYNNGSLTVNKADQTITFTGPGTKTLGDIDFTTSASSDSGLTVSFASQTTNVCTLSGSTVHLVTSGTCTIRASQAGNANYNAATNADRSFTVNPAPKSNQTITFTQPTTPATYNSTFTVSPTSDSGLTVTVTPSGGCSKSGSTITMTSGTTACKLTASQGGDADYNAASEVMRTVDATKASQTITFTGPGTKTLGDIDFTTSASSDSGLTVSFASLTTNVCTLSGSTVHLATSGTCTIRASQAGNANYNAATNADRSFTVNGLPNLVSTLTSIKDSYNNSGSTLYSSNITYTGTVTNSGSANAGASTGSFVSRVNGSGTSFFNILGATVSVPALNNPTVISSALSSPALPGGVGTYDIQLCADSTGSITELNENDNCSTVSTVTIVSLPTISVSRPLICGTVGDVNADGIISTADIDLIRAITLGKYSPSPTETAAADINGTGGVTTADITYLRQYIDGISYDFHRPGGSCAGPLTQPIGSTPTVVSITAPSGSMYSAQTCGGGVNTTSISGNTFTCTYNTAGTYTPGATIRNGGAAVTLTSSSITVTSTSSQTITFTATPTTVDDGEATSLLVTIPINLSFPVGASPYAYKCDDSATTVVNSVNSSFSCVYVNPGTSPITKTARVTVTANNFLRTETVEITVRPRATITIDAGGAIKFTPTTSGTARGSTSYGNFICGVSGTDSSILQSSDTSTGIFTCQYPKVGTYTTLATGLREGVSRTAYVTVRAR